jgi:hypothetical protein
MRERTVNDSYKPGNSNNIPPNPTDPDDIDPIVEPQPVAVDQWKNRKRLAYVSLIIIILSTLYAFILPFTGVEVAKLTFVSTVITWLFTLCSAIIGSYVGSATLVHLKSAYTFGSD